MPKEVTTTGRMDQGHLHIRNRPMFTQALSALRDGEVEVVVRRKHACRTLAANSFYWAVVVKSLSEHTGYTADEMHDFLKARFLPKTMALPGRGGEVVAEFVIGGSTAKLNTVEFYEYCRDVQEWASADLGVYIPDPHEVGA